MERFRFVKAFFLTVLFTVAITAFFFLLSWMQNNSLQESVEIYVEFFPFLRMWFVGTYLFFVVAFFMFHPMIEQAKKDLENLESED